jgi:hypothetical protein
MITVDSESFLAVVTAAALAALIGGLAGRRALVPVVVVEIVLWIVIGPEVLGLADPDDFLDFSCATRASSARASAATCWPRGPWASSAQSS